MNIILFNTDSSYIFLFIAFYYLPYQPAYNLHWKKSYSDSYWPYVLIKFTFWLLLRKKPKYAYYIIYSFTKFSTMFRLGVRVRNMKMDFGIYGTWRWVGQWILMMKIYDIFFRAKFFSCLVKNLPSSQWFFYIIIQGN